MFRQKLVYNVGQICLTLFFSDSTNGEWRHTTGGVNGLRFLDKRARSLQRIVSIGETSPQMPSTWIVKCIQLYRCPPIIGSVLLADLWVTIPWLTLVTGRWVVPVFSHHFPIKYGQQTEQLANQFAYKVEPSFFASHLICCSFTISFFLAQVSPQCGAPKLC